MKLSNYLNNITRKAHNRNFRIALSIAELYALHQPKFKSKLTNFDRFKLKNRQHVYRIAVMHFPFGIGLGTIGELENERKREREKDIGRGHQCHRKSLVCQVQSIWNLFQFKLLICSVGFIGRRKKNRADRGAPARDNQFWKIDFAWNYQCAYFLTYLV